MIYLKIPTKAPNTINCAIPPSNPNRQTPIEKAMTPKRGHATKYVRKLSQFKVNSFLKLFVSLKYNIYNNLCQDQEV